MSHGTEVLALVMAVPLVTWLAVFFYLVSIDRSLRRLELRESEEDRL